MASSVEMIMKCEQSSTGRPYSPRNVTVWSVCVLHGSALT